MTSFAFILGVTPLIILSGAGANSRGTIGSCVFGGLLMETMVGVYVTPVLFVLLRRMAEWSDKFISARLGKRENVPHFGSESGDRLQSVIEVP